MSEPPRESTWEEASTTVVRHAAEASTAEVAALVARLTGPIFKAGAYPEFFRACEALGIHVTPVHFYQPLPDTRTLPESLWQDERATPGIEWNEAVQLQLLREEFPKYQSEYNALPAGQTSDPFQFHFDAGLFGGTDALALYCMVRHFRPATVLEIGCGVSSLLTAQAARKNGNTRLICVEPYPNEQLKQGFPGLTRLIPEQVQQVDMRHFEELGANDILFIDSSHVSKIGSDVNYLFLEVLPRLRPGVIVHVHDIFLPMEYRRDWVKEEFRFWNEQYLLQAFLIFNSQFEVLFANGFLGKRHAHDMRATFPKSPWWGGGSFWMRRRI